MDTKRTILIVDDSEFVRSYHSYILEQAHFRVITAVDGSDGLEKLFSNACDLVLTDINMKPCSPETMVENIRMILMAN